MRIKNKSVLLLLLLVFTVQGAVAVPKEVEAKSEFMLATELYNKNDFAGAVEHTLAARQILGKTNPRVEAMLAKAYVALGKSIPAYAAVDKYLELAPESDKDYAEMVALYAKVKGEKKKADAAPSYLANIEMVKVPGGCFQMGDANGNGTPVHQVCLGAFAMGKFEVTQGLWLAVMGKNPSGNQKGLDYPVEQVSWNDIQAFLEALNAKTGQSYRLPSEAEWEYACRSGGKKEKYCGGDTLDGLAWYYENSGIATHRVGQKAPNGLGLYDMTGNVREWVQDCGNYTYYGAPSDGSAWTSGRCGERVIRGGSSSEDPQDARSAHRFSSDSSLRYFFFGFRLVRMLP